jgi:hypothetical protein
MVRSGIAAKRSAEEQHRFPHHLSTPGRIMVALHELQLLVASVRLKKPLGMMGRDEVISIGCDEKRWYKRFRHVSFWA